tara:strand:+ start:758 stop:1141 length:384 start_codon:yes stop_codon:yes gene_type:complete
MAGSVFESSDHQGVVKITRKDNSISMAPAEVSRARSLVGLSLSMSELENKPEHIADSPFVVRIFPKQVYALERNDQSGSIPFRVHEGDDLLIALEQGLEKALNTQTHGKIIPHAGDPGNILVPNESL